MQYSEKQHKYKFCTNVYWHLITGVLVGLAPQTTLQALPN